MKKYCFDTSGISNPWETVPVDIYQPIWDRVIGVIEAGSVAVTTEIYNEMIRITGTLGDFIRSHKDVLVMEVGRGDWDWQTYVREARDLQIRHHAFISEYTGGSPRTVCLNDISIIALARTLSLPVVSMEVSASGPGSTKRRIPDVCNTENVEHLDFNSFLRREGIKA